MVKYFAVQAGVQMCVCGSAAEYSRHADQGVSCVFVDAKLKSLREKVALVLATRLLCGPRVMKVPACSARYIHGGGGVRRPVRPRGSKSNYTFWGLFVSKRNVPPVLGLIMKPNDAGSGLGTMTHLHVSR